MTARKAPVSLRNLSAGIKRKFKSKLISLNRYSAYYTVYLPKMETNYIT